MVYFGERKPHSIKKVLMKKLSPFLISISLATNQTVEVKWKSL